MTKMTKMLRLLVDWNLTKKSMNVTKTNKN